MNVRVCPRASEVLAEEGGEVSLGAMGYPFSGHVRQVRVFFGEEFLTGLSLQFFSSTLRWICSQGSEPREHSGEYVCMLSQACPRVSKSTEDIRVRTTVWILQLIGRDQF